jgi:hypothetical protein
VTLRLGDGRSGPGVIVDSGSRRVFAASGTRPVQRAGMFPFRVAVIDAADRGSHSSYLRIYLAQLRRKLGPERSRPRHLLTEPGMGYRYRP